MNLKNIALLTAYLWNWPFLWAAEGVVDVYTHSNYKAVSVKHMALNLTLDMDQEYFHGYVDLNIDNIQKDSHVILDTKALIIDHVELSNALDGKDLLRTHHEMGNEHKVLGKPLKVSIFPDTKMVRVYYRTTKESIGIQWKKPNHTADGFPMVTTQFQAKNARTFVPCQDTPAQKITYDAQITLKSMEKDQRMGVIMAANKRLDLGNRVFYFSMTKKIPTYLMALAAGVFAEQAISHRVKIIAEPSMLKKAWHEFADAEKMVQTAESLLGAYKWERFDIFIMPPSFPYGGMENPTLTFIGPTVIAGDKSLVSVIAHELAHSWSGNLVTNGTWEDFWINEGTTMYIERLIISALYGNRVKDLDVVLGQQVLLDNMIEVMKDDGASLTCLHLNLHADFDPDDAVTYVPYEKGFNFWFALEQAYGKDAVLSFLKKMFRDYEFGSMDTKTLKQLIEKHEAFEGAIKLDLYNWLYGEGIPKGGLPFSESQAIQQVHEAITAQKEGISSSSIKNCGEFDTKQWSYFLRKIKGIPGTKLAELDHHFGITKKNDEVRANFFALAITSGLYEQYYLHIDEYLGHIGRIKYVRPIYEAMRDANLKEQAHKLFNKHKDKNTHITNNAISRYVSM